MKVVGTAQSRGTRMTALAETYAVYDRRLLAYINDRISLADWRHSEDLAQDVWLHALEYANTESTVIDPEAEMPAWLSCAARTVIRRHVSPAPPATNWSLLIDTLGPAVDWPQRWHDLLFEDGQEALLDIATAELAESESAEVPPLLVA